MSSNHINADRRRLLKAFSALVCFGLFPMPSRAADDPAGQYRPIPSTGEPLAAVGLGTWLTFDVTQAVEIAARVKLLQRFLDAGGQLVDSSPMYGVAEAVLGHCLRRVRDRAGLFSATKVWTPGRWLGIQQMTHSLSLWGLPRFDLMQVHNLLDWRVHLPTLKAWKADGRIRYLGVTTSHGRRHSELEGIMRKEPLDFIQLTYNIQDREAEDRLLPLARDRGIAVIVNRPFQRKALFRRVAGQPLPEFAGELGCRSWAQLFLKFILAHPAVTCVIPATTREDHLLENLQAGVGPMPDSDLRRRLLDAFQES